MKILFCDNIAGISGNMFAASFIDAGIVTGEEIADIPKMISLKDYKIEITKVTKAFLSSYHLETRKTNVKLNVNIKIPENHKAQHDHNHHPYLDILKRIDDSKLNQIVKNISKRIYKNLAEAEAIVHGISVDEVMFHEVGEPDSIIDVVLAGYCINKAKIEKVFSTPVKLGRGSVKIKHGIYPVPPPATLILAKEMLVDPAPQELTEQNIELSTPTGLAILKYLNPVFTKSIPSGKVKAQGYGAGTMDLQSYPNVFRIIVLEIDEAPTNLPYKKDKVLEISCNIDDQTAEKTAWCMEQLIVLGALDAWTSTVFAKKNRIAFCLSILVHEEDMNKIIDWLLRNTSTFGVRYRSWDRMILERKSEKRKISNDIEVIHKIGLTTEGKELKAKPEFEEIRKIWEKKSEQ